MTHRSGTHHRALLLATVVGVVWASAIAVAVATFGMVVGAVVGVWGLSVPATIILFAGTRVPNVRVRLAPDAAEKVTLPPAHA